MPLLLALHPDVAGPNCSTREGEEWQLFSLVDLVSHASIVRNTAKVVPTQILPRSHLFQKIKALDKELSVSYYKGL